MLRSLVDRTGLDPALVEDVIAGCVAQGGEQTMNIARNALLGAGFPDFVPGTTVDRQCGSSQQAVHFAAQGVIAGAYDVVIACGVESMSRVRMAELRGDLDPFGTAVRTRYGDDLVNQGVSAELIAARWGLARDDLDQFAARSHRLAASATDRGDFRAEIIPVPVPDGDGGTRIADTDETIRRGTNVDDLGKLSSSFLDPEVGARFPEIAWNITAGNSSPITDCASAALIMDSGRAEQFGFRPRARFHSFAVTGSDPLLMLTGVLPATEKILARSRLSIGDIDVYEVNEAFAPIPLVWQREFAADPERLNPRGGALALGHALGASGVRILATMLNHLEQTGGRYGLQTICEGGGMANALILERLS
jgi:acetyl-CoA acyltransferase